MGLRAHNRLTFINVGIISWCLGHQDMFIKNLLRKACWYNIRCAWGTSNIVMCYVVTSAMGMAMGPPGP